MALQKPSWMVDLFSHWNFRLELPPWDIVLHVLIFGVRFDWTIATKGSWLVLTLDIGDWIIIAVDAVLGVVSPAVQWGMDAWIETQSLWTALAATASDLTTQLRAYADWVAQSLVNAALATVSGWWQETIDGLAYVSGQLALVWDSVESIATTTAQRIVDTALIPYSFVMVWYQAVSVEVIAFLNDPSTWLIDHVLNGWIEDFTRGLNRELDNDDV